MTIDLLKYNFEELNNTYIAPFIESEISILQLIDHFCLQIDQMWVYIALGILLMYVSNLTLIPFFRSLIKNERVKALSDRLITALDGMGLMSAMYIVYMSYRQIGFDSKSWLLLSTIVFIIVFGNIYNLIQWIKKKRGNLEEKIGEEHHENKPKGDLDRRD